jgi:predicted transcriptional regulator of viral defense system
MTYNIILMNHQSVIMKTIGPISSAFLYKITKRGKDIFTLDEACEIYGHGKRETSDFLGDLVNREVLARIKSGVFLILKMGQESTELSNWPIIAKILVNADNYYISHYSAMRLHGMTTHPLTTVTTTILKRHATKKIQNISYQFIYSKSTNFWGFSEKWVTKNEKVLVSDLERTILDGLCRPDLCGGIKEVVRGLWVKQKEINWERLVQYSGRYQTKASIKRLGFILELLGLGINSLPFLADEISIRKDYILFDPTGAKTGKFLKKWHIRINMNIEELKEGVWG